MLWRVYVRYRKSCARLVLRVESKQQHTVMLMADMDELLLQLVLDLLEGLDGFLAGFVGWAKLDSLRSGLEVAVNKI
jgi:hypothetical protein